MSSLPGVSEPGDSFVRHRRDVVYEGRIVRVFRDGITLPNGVDADYEVLEYPRYEELERQFLSDSGARL